MTLSHVRSIPLVTGECLEQLQLLWRTDAMAATIRAACEGDRKKLLEIEEECFIEAWTGTVSKVSSFGLHWVADFLDCIGLPKLKNDETLYIIYIYT
jgi:hypothetical protein